MAFARHSYGASISQDTKVEILHERKNNIVETNVVINERK